MADTYFKIKIIFDYIVPLALLCVCTLPWIYLFGLSVVNDWKKKRRNRKNGKVRKKDDAV